MSSAEKQTNKIKTPPSGLLFPYRVEQIYDILTLGIDVYLHFKGGGDVVLHFITAPFLVVYSFARIGWKYILGLTLFYAAFISLSSYLSNNSSWEKNLKCAAVFIPLENKDEYRSTAKYFITKTIKIAREDGVHMNEQDLRARADIIFSQFSEKHASEYSFTKAMETSMRRCSDIIN